MANLTFGAVQTNINFRRFNFEEGINYYSKLYELLKEICNKYNVKISKINENKISLLHKNFRYIIEIKPQIEIDIYNFSYADAIEFIDFNKLFINCLNTTFKDENTVIQISNLLHVATNVKSEINKNVVKDMCLIKINELLGTVITPLGISFDFEYKGKKYLLDLFQSTQKSEFLLDIASSRYIEKNIPFDIIIKEYDDLKEMTNEAVKILNLEW